MPIIVGAPDGNKTVNVIYLGTPDGNKVAVEAWVGTPAGNKLISDSLSAEGQSFGWFPVYDESGKTPELVGYAGYFSCSVSGGVAPYTYSWSAPGGNFTFDPPNTADTTAYAGAEGPSGAPAYCQVTDAVGNVVTTPPIYY